VFRRVSVRISAEDNTYSIHVTFEGLTASLPKIQVFQDVTPCDWYSYCHFEEPFWLQLQCQMSNKSSIENDYLGTQQNRFSLSTCTREDQSENSKLICNETWRREKCEICTYSVQYTSWTEDACNWMYELYWELLLWCYSMWCSW
jgi:hypothetical protein